LKKEKMEHNSDGLSLSKQFEKMRIKYKYR
jgi:hypothetical protein